MNFLTISLYINPIFIFPFCHYNTTNYLQFIMILLLTFLIFLSFPLSAWAYVDPGFGGYLYSSITNFIVTGFAFISATFIYFFRTIFAQQLGQIWLKHQKLCLNIIICILAVSSFGSGAWLYKNSHQSFIFILLQFWAYSDSCFGRFFGYLIILLVLVSILLIAALISFISRFA